MPGSYRHISDYENEITEMRSEGKTRKEICETFGFTKNNPKTILRVMQKYNLSS